jgi:selenocysteine lyase/cysteine desulfurase
VNSADDDLVFVDNASAGVNAFLRSFARTLKKGDKIFYLSTAYGMVKSVIE